MATAQFDLLNMGDEELELIRQQLKQRDAQKAEEAAKAKLKEEIATMKGEYLEKCYKSTQKADGTQSKKLSAEKVESVIEELCIKIKELEKTPPKKSAGGSKTVKKGRAVKPIQIVNQVKRRGFCDGACGAVVWKSNKNYTHRVVSQCQSDPASEEGLCVKHQKEMDEKGFLRSGRMTAENVEVGADFFGTESQWTSFTTEASRWVRMYLNALEEGLVEEVEK